MDEHGSLVWIGGVWAADFSNILTGVRVWH